MQMNTMPKTCWHEVCLLRNFPYHYYAKESLRVESTLLPQDPGQYARNCCIKQTTLSCNLHNKKTVPCTYSQFTIFKNNSISRTHIPFPPDVVVVQDDEATSGPTALHSFQSIQCQHS